MYGRCYSAPVCNAHGVVHAWLFLKVCADDDNKAELQSKFIDHISSLGCWTMQVETTAVNGKDIVWLSNKEAWGWSSEDVGRQVDGCKYGIRPVAGPKQVDLYTQSAAVDWKLEDFLKYVVDLKGLWRDLHFQREHVPGENELLRPSTKGTRSPCSFTMSSAARTASKRKYM